MTADTKATIHYNGRVTWQPPASFKSTCNIDVTYFPFDQQACSLEFGSWTYNLDEVCILNDVLNLLNYNLTHDLETFSFGPFPTENRNVFLFIFNCYPKQFY